MKEASKGEKPYSLRVANRLHTLEFRIKKPFARREIATGVSKNLDAGLRIWE
jgi:hypothetical protein